MKPRIRRLRMLLDAWQYERNPFQRSIAKDAGWFSVWGYGLQWKRTPPLFSERNGFVKFARIPFTRWRVGILRPRKGWWADTHKGEPF